MLGGGNSMMMMTMNERTSQVRDFVSRRQGRGLGQVASRDLERRQQLGAAGQPGGEAARVLSAMLLPAEPCQGTCQVASSAAAAVMGGRRGGVRCEMEQLQQQQLQQQSQLQLSQQRQW
ncbi:unnamed protein product [Lampetra fluviatilis]